MDLFELLTEIFPRYLKYRSVLEATQKELAAIAQAGLDDNINQRGLKRLWARFKRLVEDQYSILDQIRSNAVHLYQMCNYPEVWHDVLQ
ncbi:hypothetical protein QCA50_005244 [Cerrena zonata]|uniref:Uncharacterized protein n=1 Tax=Cerrena zonata TaxID=2478898 RepID=A0AAW0GRG8_9APHY